MTDQLVEVHLACNDPRSGTFIGIASGLEILAHNDVALSLEPVTGDTGPRCRITSTTLRLSRTTYPIREWATWVGNWCWDSVRVDVAAAARILNDARASGWWSPDSGWSAMWERWDSTEHPFTESFLRDQLVTPPIIAGPEEPEQVGAARHRFW